MSDSKHLPLKCVNHISKVCSDLARSVAFYKDVLGFVVVKRPSSFDATFDGCWLWRYGLGLHLIKGQPVPRSSHIDPKSDHLSFQSDSLEEVQAQLRRLDIPFVCQQVLEDGLEVQQLFFHDPDNNMIEVCNCDCLPIIPVDMGSCQPATLSAADALQLQCSRAHFLRGGATNGGSHSDDDVMSDGGSRDSMDSVRSEQCNNIVAGLLPPVALAHE